MNAIAAPKIADDDTTKPQDSPDAEENTESEDEEAKADPTAASASMLAAQQELTVLIDLIDSVAGQRAVSTQFVDRPKTRLEAWREVSRVAEGTKQQLRAGASRLRSAAATLRRQVQQDNAFVRELGELQVCCACIILTSLSRKQSRATRALHACAVRQQAESASSTHINKLRSLHRSHVFVHIVQ